MKISDLLSIPWEQINKMSYEEMYKYQKQIGVYAERRRKAALEAYHRNNIPLPTIYKDEVNTKFSFKPSGNKNDLRRQISKTRNFLEAKTSTIKGWKDTLKNFVDRLNEKVGLDDKSINKFELDENQYKALWDIYNKLEEIQSSATTKDFYDSNQRQREIYEAMDDLQIPKDMSSDLYKEFIGDMVDYFSEKIRNKYEETQLNSDDISSEDILSLGSNNEYTDDDNFIKRKK
jgi:hypothetical protein